MFDKKHAQYADIIHRLIRDKFQENMRQVFFDDESPWAGETQHFSGITDPGTDFSGGMVLAEDDTARIITTIQIVVGKRKGSFEYRPGLLVENFFPY